MPATSTVAADPTAVLQQSNLPGEEADLVFAVEGPSQQLQASSVESPDA